jgi:hypothetical protein
LRGEKPASHIGEFAMVVGQCDTHCRAFLLDAIGRSERVYLNAGAAQPGGRSGMSLETEARAAVRAQMTTLASVSR